ncbi:MAG: GNAT family N-acetyltransferase, partial [Erythrobacter sp.]
MAIDNWIIRPFRPADAPAFAALNKRWIEELFELEESDLRQLEHPQTAILDKGGFIAIADANGWAVGTGAILPAAHPPQDGRSWFEVIKMTTDLAAQRSGIGSAIMQRLLEFAREHGADAVWLETNAKLEAAYAAMRKRARE